MLSPSMKASAMGQRSIWSRTARWLPSPVPESPRKASRISRSWPRSVPTANSASTTPAAAPGRRRMAVLAAVVHGHAGQLVVEMDGGGDALAEVAQVQALVLAVRVARRVL